MAAVSPRSAGTPTRTWTGTWPVQVAPVECVETWAAASRAAIDEALVAHGAMLVKGCRIASAERFGQVAACLTDHLLEYVCRSTPRTMLAPHVYTAAEYASNLLIPLHNEHADQREWPMRLAFCCLQPAASGGEMLLARTARVMSRLDPEVVRTFRERGVMYVRNYGKGIELPWETVFQTRARADVEAFCRRQSIDWEWLPEGRLRTRQVCQAVARHPTTGEPLWFNQAHLFHISSLEAVLRKRMLDLFDEADLPRQAYFGDGTPIEDAMLDHIREAYEAETFALSWQLGDVLLVDNMLVAHGRSPFTGLRKVLVAMGTPCQTGRRKGVTP